MKKKTTSQPKSETKPKKARNDGPTKGNEENPKSDGFLLVGIGASAGGIQALKEFFE